MPPAAHQPQYQQVPYYPQPQYQQVPYYACVGYPRRDPATFTKTKATPCGHDRVMAVDPMTHRSIRFKKYTNTNVVGLYAPDDGQQATDTVKQVRFMIIDANMDIVCYYAEELRDGWEKATGQQFNTYYWKPEDVSRISSKRPVTSSGTLKQYDYTNDHRLDGPELKVDSNGKVTVCSN